MAKLLDRDDVRRASPLVEVIPVLTGHPMEGDGAERRTRCPLHEDTHPSLRVNSDKQQWYCDVCGVGGDVFKLVEQVQKCDFAEALRWLAERAGLGATRTSRQVVATYDYRDETGTLLFQKVRFTPKGFQQRCPDGQGGWSYRLNGIRRVLYRLPDLKGREAVVLVEGERDADKLWALGIPATTAPDGASTRKGWQADYTAQLTAAGVRRLAAIPDNDDPGRAYVDQAAASCHAAGLVTRVVTLPDVPAKGDVSDYLERHSKDELLTLIRGVPVYEPAASAGAGNRTETTAPDPSTLSCEALLAEHELCALDEHIDRAVLDGRLRKLAVALRGSDRLRVALVRDTLITHLREAAKIRTATKIVDAAFTIEAPTPETHQGTPLLLADVDPWPEPVDGNVVLDEVIRTITRFIVLPTHGAVALALWILHTYLMDAWWLSPLAVATSPTRRCGKTALLTVVSELVHRPVAASNISPAALFRAVEKYQPTLLLDEGETWLKANEELRGIVNAGHTRRTAMVIRTVGDDHEPATFSTWCAKFIALIGELPDTLMDRAIVIEMRRKTAAERVERLRLEHLPDVCEPLRRQMARWAADHAAGLGTLDPDVPSALHDRAADNWRPLLALGDALGGEWPTRARAAAQTLAGVDQEDAIGVQLLWDIKEAFANEPVMSSKALLDALVAMEERPWAIWSKQGKPMTPHGLARLLRRFHIVSAGNIRVGDKVLKSYRRATFEDSWARYPLQTATRNNSNNDGPQPENPDRYTDPSVALAKTAVEPMNTRDYYGVALQNQGEAQFREF